MENANFMGKKKKKKYLEKNQINAVRKSLFTIQSTLKCLSIGTPKIINFPFVSNGKL